MSEEANTSVTTITVAPDRSGNFVDPSFSKIDDIESELVELVDDIKSRSNIMDKAIEELAAVAKASQLPDYYKALALMLAAAAKQTRETTVALKTRADLIVASSTDKDSAAAPSVTNNTLIMTTTDMIRQLKEDNE